MVQKPHCLDCGTRLSQDDWAPELCPRCLMQLALEQSPVEMDAAEDPEAIPTSAFPNHTLSPGQILGGRFQIRSLLGRGGMGSVWRAYDLKLRVDVALKTIREELLQKERALQALRQEVRTAREVISPNVCRVFDLVELEGQELVSMEYIDGTTLLGILHSRGPLELQEAREIASQFLAGLESIHQAGLIHRDLKPENVMITRSGRVVVMDFGIAKGLADQKVGTVSGTPAYMAPEQSRGEEVNARADVFSAGVVLAEMIAPKGLKTLQARKELWEGVHREPPELPDSPWASVLSKAVAHRAQDRYASASALARALEEITLQVEGAEDVQPYPGLASFTEEDAEYFFGRELEVEAMWKKLRRPHLLGLVGPSGAGKSSFIRAGLLPVMPKGWRVVVCTPGTEPFQNLARALVPEFSGDTEAMQQLLGITRLDAALSILKRWREQHTEVLVIVDQFEELFTLNPAEIQSRFAELLGAMSVDLDVRVLLSMRDDFFLHCHEYRSLAPIFSDPTPLQAPTGAALRRALVQPALKCGYRFEEDALVDEMIDEVSEERGALPLLAFAASRLWEHRDRDRGLLTREAYEHIGGVGGALAQHAEATLEKIGRDQVPIVRELFRNLVTSQGTRATRTIEELLSLFEDKEVAEDVLRALVDARLLTSFEIAGGDEEERNQHRVEIIHESLLTAWPRLVRWKMQDAEGAKLRDDLRQAAKMWVDRHRSEDLLWTGTAFREFQLWHERYPGGLTEVEESFARAMAAKAERKKKRRRLAMVGALVLAFGIAAVTGTLWRRSVAETRRAEASKLLALGKVDLEDNSSNALAYATASLELAADTLEARRFALEALWRGPTQFRVGVARPVFGPDGQWLATGEDGKVRLHQEKGGSPMVLPGKQGSQRRGTAGDSRRSQFAGPDRLVVPVGRRNRLALSIWSLSRNQETREIDLSGYRDIAEWWVRGDRFIAWVADRKNKSLARVVAAPLDEGEPALLGQVEIEEIAEPVSWREVSGAEVDPSGALLAYRKGRAFVLKRLDDLEGQILIGHHDESVRSAVFDPVGERVASVDTTGEVRLWPTSGEASQPSRILATGHESLREVGFDPTGTRLATRINSAGVGAIWDLSGPPDAEPLYLKRQPGGWWGNSQFHPSGQWLVYSIQGVGGPYAYPLSRPYATVFRGHKSNVFALAFSPDGKWLASATREGRLHLWPLSPDVAEKQRLVTVPAQIFRLVFDPEGRFVVTGQFARGDPEKSRPLVVPTDGREPWHLSRGDDDCLRRVIAVGPGGRLVAAGCNFRQQECWNVRIWDMETGTSHILDLGEDAGAVSSLVFTPEGRLLVASGGRVHLWDVEDGTHEQLGDLDQCIYMKLSRDGRTLGCLSSEKREGVLFRRVFVYDREKGIWRHLSRYESRAGHDALRSFAVSPDGTFLAAGDETGAVRLGPVTGDEPHLLLGHQGTVTEVAISPDGKWIASAGDDATVRLWPVPEGQPLHTLPFDELMKKLRSLTNFRAVPDEDSATGYRIDFDPFPGWKKVPTW